MCGGGAREINTVGDINSRSKRCVCGEGEGREGPGRSALLVISTVGEGAMIII